MTTHVYTVSIATRDIVHGRPRTIERTVEIPGPLTIGRINIATEAAAEKLVTLAPGRAIWGAGVVAVDGKPLYLRFLKRRATKDEKSIRRSLTMFADHPGAWRLIALDVGLPVGQIRKLARRRAPARAEAIVRFAAKHPRPTDDIRLIPGLPPGWR